MLTETANVNLAERYERRATADAAASYGADTAKLMRWASKGDAPPNLPDMARLQARCAARFGRLALEATCQRCRQALAKPSSAPQYCERCQEAFDAKMADPMKRV